MIEEFAQVRGLRGDKVLIEVLRQSACQGCQMSGSCGTGSLGRLLGFRARPLLIDNHENLAVGDRLVIGIADNAYLMAALLIYILPLLSMLAVALVADSVPGLDDFAIALSAAGGLALGVAVAVGLSRYYFRSLLEVRTIRRI